MVTGVRHDRVEGVNGIADLLVSEFDESLFAGVHFQGPPSCIVSGIDHESRGLVSARRHPGVVYGNGIGSRDMRTR